jgi:hypothetical protein
MAMKKLLVFIFLLSFLNLANAYEGLYFTTYVGLDGHIELDSIKFPQANPYNKKLVAETNCVGALNFDIGYTFYKVPISLALGVEMNNWVDPNLRVVIKYNFLADKLLSPYIYTELHGGLLDVMSFGIHLGFGLDVQVTDWFFIGIDARAGYDAESKVQTKLSTVLKASDFENELEGTISVGAGFKIPIRRLIMEKKK